MAVPLNVIESKRVPAVKSFEFVVFAAPLGKMSVSKPVPVGPVLGVQLLVFVQFPFTEPFHVYVIAAVTTRSRVVAETVSDPAKPVGNAPMTGVPVELVKVIKRYVPTAGVPEILTGVELNATAPVDATPSLPDIPKFAIPTVVPSRRFSVPFVLNVTFPVVNLPAVATIPAPKIPLELTVTEPVIVPVPRNVPPLEIV